MRSLAAFVILALVFLATQSAVGRSAVAKERNPALKSLVDESDEVFVAKVLKTSPRNAIEGARDTVVVEVEQCLKGNLKKEQKVGIYYHLLWIDTAKLILEDKKFETDKEYVLFTTSAYSDHDKKTKYELTDRWLSVQKPHPRLIEEIKKKPPICSIALSKDEFSVGEEIRIRFSADASTHEPNDVFSSLLDGKGMIQLLSGATVVHEIKMYPISAPKTEGNILSFFHLVPGRDSNLKIQKGQYSVQAVLGRWQSNTVKIRIE